MRTKQFPRAVAGAVLAALLASCDLFLPEVERTYAGQAVWAQDSSAVLVLETRYATTRPERPYWDSTVGHTAWRVNVYVAPPGDLSARSLVAVWDDTAGDARDGGPQSTDLAWHRGATGNGKVFYVTAGSAVMRDLDAGTRVALSLPWATQNRYFWDMLRYDGNPPTALSALPSPDGRYVAVNYQVMAGDVLNPDFLKCLAVFDASGSFIAAWDPRADAVDAASVKSQMRLRMAPIVPRHANPEPPGFQALNSVPSHRDPYFLWGADSRTIYLAGKYLDGVRFSYTLSLNPEGGTFISFTSNGAVPKAAIPVPGRAVSDDGRLLSVETTEDGLSARLYFHRLTGWVPHGQNPLVPYDSVDYGF